jgi:hypothetical protein
MPRIAIAGPCNAMRSSQVPKEAGLDDITRSPHSPHPDFRPWGSWRRTLPFPPSVFFPQDEIHGEMSGSGFLITASFLSATPVASRACLKLNASPSLSTCRRSSIWDSGAQSALAAARGRAAQDRPLSGEAGNRLTLPLPDPRRSMEADRGMIGLPHGGRWPMVNALVPPTKLPGR